MSYSLAIKAFSDGSSWGRCETCGEETTSDDGDVLQWMVAHAGETGHE